MTQIPAYVPSSLEKKWQDIWEKEAAFQAKQDYTLPKFYGLVEFPYPSGNGLHVGHPRSYTAMDILARKRRLEGYNVLYPIGWDAFGLPAENFAIKTGIHPHVVTQQNIDRFRSQLKMLGLSYDYSREVDTTDPNYYHWTQWIFLQLFKAGLAYKAEMPINWCTSCKVGLANEEVVDGVCERCGGEVVRRVKSQWMLKITDYAQKLLDGLDEVDFIEKVKIQQKNWIGKSMGAEVDFGLSGIEDHLRVFTTRCDTMFGVTYMVISPEHALLAKYQDRIENLDEIRAYQIEASRKSEFERTQLNKDKTGVQVKGIMAINPANQSEIPVFVSDYVLTSYGTGAIMAVPGHDERDWAFAKKFDLPIVEVVGGGNVEKEAYVDIENGTMVNSGFLTGLSVKDAIARMLDYLEENHLGERKVNFKLRDWVFSRQRYWGEPIPIVWCDHCGAVPLKEEDLPLMLPEVEHFQPGEDGESPLAAMEDWVHTTCPVCGGLAHRETDTMPQWAGSSWYFLRYTDPHNQEALASEEALKYWLPVDWYNGGMEHTTLHLLYSRFWHKFLYDAGVVPTKEPYQKRTSHGMILGANGEKMSKSRGNVVNPDDMVNEYGADAFRMYEMFMGAFDQAIPWSTNGVQGCRRFLDRVWKLMEMVEDTPDYSADLLSEMHFTIKKVGEDIERMKFNTAIAQMMTFVNAVYKKGSITKGELRSFLILLNPVSPHVTEEMWQMLGFCGRLYQQKWPEYDEKAMVKDEVEIALQLNGKMKLRLLVRSDLTAKDAQEEILKIEKVASLLEGKTIRKFIFIPGRLCNIVVS